MTQLSTYSHPGMDISVYRTYNEILVIRCESDTWRMDIEITGSKKLTYYWLELYTRINSKMMLS